jgi:hypothetical protein
METPETYDEAKDRRRQRTIVLVIAGIALCCVCLAIGVAIYSWSAIRGGGADLDVVPEAETAPSNPENSLTPSFAPTTSVDPDVPDADAGEAPTGGLGNDILRNDTWQAVAAAAAGQGCDQPVGADSTIEVLQEPDAAGVWVEQWTVACSSGDSYAFEVEYILDATGATFNIQSLP